MYGDHDEHKKQQGKETRFRLGFDKPFDHYFEAYEKCCPKTWFGSLQDYRRVGVYIVVLIIIFALYLPLFVQMPPIIGDKGMFEFTGTALLITAITLYPTDKVKVDSYQANRQWIAQEKGWYDAKNKIDQVELGITALLRSFISLYAIISFFTLTSVLSSTLAILGEMLSVSSMSSALLCLCQNINYLDKVVASYIYLKICLGNALDHLHIAMKNLLPKVCLILLMDIKYSVLPWLLSPLKSLSCHMLNPEGSNSKGFSSFSSRSRSSSASSYALSSGAVSI